VRAVEFAAVLAAALALALAWVRRAAFRRRALPTRLALLAEAIADALGDAVVAVDDRGRIGHANTAAARLVGASVADLVDGDAAEVAPEVVALARGVERGPAAAQLTVPGPRGPVRVRAAVVRVRTRPAWSLVVLRPAIVRRQRPPPLPPGSPRIGPSHGVARAALAASAAALDDPLARAAAALSILRLASPPLGARAAEALAAAEAALEIGARRVFALGEAGRGGAARALDLAALAAELAASFAAPHGIRVRVEAHGDARALADDRPVRAALREVLVAAASSSPPGAELVVVARAGTSAATLEVWAPARVQPGGLSLARALVAPQGGRVEEDGAPGQGALVRIALAAAGPVEHSAAIET
jgi:hypothetical protein